MKKSITLMVSVLALSACGKSLHLTNQAPLLSPNELAKSTGAKSDSSLSTHFDGQLTSLSLFDEQNLLSMMPYLNKEDAANAVQSVGVPAFKEESGKDALGYVKKSNLIFRAVLQVPPKEAITKIDRFALQLKGLRRFSQKGEDGTTLAKQVICIADTKICSGERAESTAAEKKNLNAEFWASAKVLNDVFSKVKTEEVLWSNAKTGDVISTPAAEEKLGFAAGEEVLDMRALFSLEKLSDAELVEWIYENSTPYAEPGYRKFRFVIGNNVYIESGDLILQLEKNDKKMPADFAQIPSKLINGDQDSNPATTGARAAGGNDTPPVAGATAADGSATAAGDAPTAGTVASDAPTAGTLARADAAAELPGETSDVEIVMTAQKLRFKPSSSALSRADAKKVRATALILKKRLKSIEMLRVNAETDKAGPAEDNQTLSQKRANAVATLLRKNGIPAVLVKSNGLGEVKRSACKPWENCPEDRRVILQIQLNRAMTKEEKANAIESIEFALKKVWN